VVSDKKNHTRDLGGNSTTTLVGDAVAAKIAG
jgi:isocitrate/isopropylmalate dehydrogenase